MDSIIYSIYNFRYTLLTSFLSAVYTNYQSVFVTRITSPRRSTTPGSKTLSLPYN